MALHLLVCVLSSALIFEYAQAAAWSYTGMAGPGKWRVTFPTCAGKRQSPIDINCAYATSSEGLELDYINYDTPLTGEFTVINSGHSVDVKVPACSGISIENGQLPYRYALDHFHFHWGSNNSRGSEHSHHGKFSPMEIHFVHYNSDLYPDVATAANQKNGLAVIAVLVDVKNMAVVPQIDELVNTFIKIPYQGDTITMPPFAISSLLPTNRKFFRYSGSLTTPPCYETVIWSVFLDKIQITEAQLNQFRSLNSNIVGTNNMPLVDNRRPIQPLNGRRVLKSI